jgi:hypothetical protein
MPIAAETVICSDSSQASSETLTGLVDARVQISELAGHR